MTSKMIVANPADAAYSTIPSPPQWGVIRNYEPLENRWLTSLTERCATPDAAELVITLIRLYEDGRGATPSNFLDLAKNVAGFLVDNLFATTYNFGGAKDMTLMGPGYFFDEGGTDAWVKYEGEFTEYSIRNNFQAAYALMRLSEHDSETTYGGKTLEAWALEMLDSGRQIQVIVDYITTSGGVDVTHPGWMNGAFPEYMVENSSGGVTLPAELWPLNIGDYVWKAYTLGANLYGNSQTARDGSGAYNLTDVRDAWYAFAEEAIDNQGGMMSDTDGAYVGLPYQYIWTEAPGFTPVGANIYHPDSSTPSPTADWTSDAIFWAIEGFALAGHLEAGAMWDEAVSLASGNPKTFVDSYKVDGTPGDGALPVTQANALAIRSGKVLSKDYSDFIQYLEDTQISGDDADITDGGWTWTGRVWVGGGLDGTPRDQLEAIAIAVIIGELGVSPDFDS